MQVIVAALCMALGGVSFEQADLPGLYIRYGIGLEGIQHANLRHADLDDDGHVDILLPTGVYFRPDGNVRLDRSIPMPAVPNDSRADVWDHTLYVMSPSNVATYELADGAWTRTRDLTHDWTLQETYRFEPEEKRPSMTFDRFLHDLDGDGQPEIVRVDAAGLAVSAVREGELKTTVLDLYPSPHLETMSGHPALWPATERRIAFPERNASFHVVIDGTSASVIEHIRQGVNAFSIEQYGIAVGEDGGFSLNHESSYQTGPLPRHVAVPIALNQDGVVDFVGERYDRPSYRSWKPIARSFASTDGGKSVVPATTLGFYQQSYFVDLNGDHALDWIGEESGLVNGGLRETANRALFQRRFSHTVKAHMQHSDGSFDRDWQVLGRFTIHLDEPARHYTYRFWQYTMGDLIDCTGDFNGDGWRDILVYDLPDSVALHLSGPAGYGKRPETRIGVPLHTFPVAIDLDGDGLSDIAIMQHSSRAPVAVHLNKGGAG